MPQTASQSPRIFICYRRNDSAGHAGRLCDRLGAHFGDEQIFMDIDYIKPGEDFVRVIEKVVGSCEVLLAVMGQGWLASRDETGRLLDNPNDFVRREISAALARDVRVIPVLVQGAQMPRPQDLPEDLLPFARRQAHELSDLRWKQDVDQLIGVLDKVLALRDEVQTPEDPDLEPNEIEILKMLAHPYCDGTEDYLSQSLELSRTRVQFHLTELKKKGYVTANKFNELLEPLYELTQKARGFLIKNNHIE